jgi:fumarate reductase subunit C
MLDFFFDFLDFLAQPEPENRFFRFLYYAVIIVLGVIFLVFLVAEIISYFSQR